jgi:TP901 family phage tail tape measure protein
MAIKEEFKLSMLVEANTDRFKKGMSEVNQGLAASGGKMGKMARMGKLGFAAIATAAVAAGAAIGIAFIMKSIQKFVEFEETLFRIAAISGETGLAGIDPLKNKIMELGAATKSTTTQVAEAAEILTLAGFSMEEMIGDESSGTQGALEALNNFAIAAGTDLPNAAGIAIATMKGMGKEASELRNITDILLNTQAKTFTTVNDLGESMKFLAPTARASGIALEEAAAAAGILGDAGLKGSMAGTALRMAITKLLKPSDDARKLMEDLGLDFFTLTPAGQAAKSALREVSRGLEASKLAAESTNAQLKILNSELNEMSIEQQTNSLAIMKIKRRAEKEGRELNKRELDQISRLEGANADLNITMAEKRITQQQVNTEASKNNELVSEQSALFSDLNKQVAGQTTGITSLSDVFQQLGAAGATTNQMLEIFGIRGGTAAMAMLANADALDELTASNFAAQDGMGRTSEQIAVMEQSGAFALASLNSKFESFMLMVGEVFTPILVDKVIPALIKFIDEALIPMLPAFQALAEQMGDVLPDLLEALVPLFLVLAEVIIALAPILKLTAMTVQLLMFVLKPFLDLLGGIAEMLTAIFDQDAEAFGEGMKRAFGGLLRILFPVLHALEGIFGFLDSTGNSVDEATGMNISGAAKGAAVGAVVGGPVGALVGAGIGMAFFAEGGIVNSPTLGMVGEAGSEAIMPIDKIDGIMASALQRAETGGTGGNKTTLNISGGISIGEGNNLNKRDVRDAVRQALSDVAGMKSSGARGVI